jgi:hypothetical protein
MALAHRIGVCRLTVRRRIDGLIERKLAAVHDSLFMVTDAGVQALGDAASPRPQPWVNLAAISAANAPDVLSRSPTDDRTRAMRSQHATLAATTMRLRGQQPFSTLAEFDRMAG